MLFILKKAFSDESESFIFCEKVFTNVGCLTCYTFKLLFLYEYKKVYKSCMDNA